MLLKYETLHKASTRTYQGYTKEHVIKACETALFSFENDYAFNHTPQGFSAKRTWHLFLVLAAATGSHYWTISVDDSQEDTVIVSANAWQGSMSSASATIVPVVGGGGGSVVPVTRTDFADGENHDITMIPAVYNLFFARVEYVLGVQGSRYVSCKEAEKTFYTGFATMEYDPLCFLGKDRNPKSAAFKK